MTEPLRLLQISDSHLMARPGATLIGVDTAATLAAVLDQALTEHRPDAIVASGDLAHDPEPDAYRRFQGIVTARFDGDLLCLPGNHDLGGPLAQVLGAADSLRLGDWQVLAFDSHADGRTEARFCAADRRALEARIDAAPADFLLLFCHHPPLPVGCPWLDKDCIPDGRELLESCAARSRLRGLAFGHIHQPLDAAVDALAVLGTPSTCFQFQPASARFAIDRDPVRGMPGYRWLELQGDGTLRSRVGRLRGAPLNIDLSDRS